MLYAHGGLNSEEKSVERIKVLAPYFKANGIYPLFLTWKTGPVETVAHVLEDELTRVRQPAAGMRDWLERWREQLGEARDRTLEVAAGPIGKPIWSEMKQNAAASAKRACGTALIARHLAELSAAVDSVQFHVVGHSAGAILLGHLLSVAKGYGVTFRSCSLYAPACTIEFANQYYRPRVVDGTIMKRDLHVHVLSDAREREDTVGPYGKSLLCLVSRALETTHKTPLLGLENVFSPTPPPDVWNGAQPLRQALTAWQRWWREEPAGNLHVVDERHLSTGSRGRGCKASHGCFDNHADTIRGTLTRILGGQPRHGIESLDF